MARTCWSSDPEVHPQTEDYWGHVNPIGPRACYDEGKRVAETICYAYAKQVSLCIFKEVLSCQICIILYCYVECNISGVEPRTLD